MSSIIRSLDEIRTVLNLGNPEEPKNGTFSHLPDGSILLTRNNDSDTAFFFGKGWNWKNSEWKIANPHSNKEYYLVNKEAYDTQNFSFLEALTKEFKKSSVELIEVKEYGYNLQADIFYVLGAFAENLRVAEYDSLFYLKKDTELNLTPSSQKLRFKDENNNWYPEPEVAKLGELLTQGKAGGTPNSSERAFYGGEIPFLGISDITKQGKYVITTEKTLTKLGLDNSAAWIVPEGSLIYAMYASVGKVAINKFRLATSQALFSMKFKENICLEYVYNFFVHHTRTKLKTYITTGTQGNINAQTLKNFNIPVPSLPEQEKIAAFLSALDDRITLQERKLELLKQQKQGYLQRIFNQTLRFKDENGEWYPEWEILSIEDIFDNYSGVALEKHYSPNATLRVISIGSYSSDSKYKDQNLRIDPKLADSKRILKIGNLAMVLNDKTKSGDIIGKTLLIEDDNTYVVNQRSERLMIKDESSVNPNFCYHLLNSTSFRKKIISIAQGGTQIYVNFSQIKKLKLGLPSLPEQEKIAKFFSTTDKHIELQESQLQLTKSIKRDYMQSFFG